MTIDEAIKTFRSRKALAFADGYADQVQGYIEAMSVAITALREKQERENIIRDIKADMKPDDTYSVALVLELLGDKAGQPDSCAPCFPGQSAHKIQYPTVCGKSIATKEEASQAFTEALSAVRWHGGDEL